MFFSGRRFPLATLSSMDDQIFFLFPSLLVGRPPAPPESSLNVDIRCPIATILREIKPCPAPIKFQARSIGVDFNVSFDPRLER